MNLVTDCECLHWTKCDWSRKALNIAKGVSKDSEEFKRIKLKISQNICGIEREEHMIYCCGSDQYPLEDNPAIPLEAIGIFNFSYFSAIEFITSNPY